MILNFCAMNLRIAGGRAARIRASSPIGIRVSRERNRMMLRTKGESMVKGAFHITQNALCSHQVGGAGLTHELSNSIDSEGDIRACNG